MGSDPMPDQFEITVLAMVLRGLFAGVCIGLTGCMNTKPVPTRHLLKCPGRCELITTSYGFLNSAEFLLCNQDGKPVVMQSSTNSTVQDLQALASTALPLMLGKQKEGASCDSD